jgi:predicted nucleotidyltransferase
MGKIHELCERFHVQRLEAFGSAADGRYREGESDLDFMVEFEPMEPLARGEAFLGLLMALEDLFERHIDLVTPRPLGEGNPYFWRQANTTRQVIYEQHKQEVPV